LCFKYIPNIGNAFFVFTRDFALLNTSVDFLINGNTDEKAKASLKNTELLQRFKEVEALPEHEQSVMLEIIGTYILDFRTKQAYVH
jgi:hypothetical protein